MIPTPDHEQRARDIIEKVKMELTPIWLGGRQRVVLESCIAQALADAEAQGAATEREACAKVVEEYLTWQDCTPWIAQTIRQRGEWTP